MRVKHGCIMLMCVMLSFGFEGSVRSKVEKANKAYAQGEYEKALTGYTDAQLTDPRSSEVFFNMGNTLYKQRKYDEALGSFQKARDTGRAVQHESNALYNSGCALYRAGKLKESLDAFKEALAKNPSDQDTKFNVEFVEQKIKEMLSEAQKTQQQCQQQQRENQQNQQQQQQQQSAQAGQQKPDEQKNDQQQAGQQDRKKDEESKEVGGGEQKKEQHTKDAAPQPQKTDTQKKGADEKGEVAGQARSADPEDVDKEKAERFLDMLSSEEQPLVPQRDDDQPARQYEHEKDW